MWAEQQPALGPIHSTDPRALQIPGNPSVRIAADYYDNNWFNSSINGTASAPILIRNYGGQRATLDAKGTPIGLAVYGSYTWYWGLEVIDSTTERYGTDPGQADNQPANAPGVGIYGPNNKFINMIVHDTLQGFSAYNASPNSEFTGNLSYYNGYAGSDRNYGHGMYMQNATGTKLLFDNIVGDNFDEGMQIYGSGSADWWGSIFPGTPCTIRVPFLPLIINTTCLLKMV